jgi:5S rRNA maturation endonuclease (ribonuclease M5)
MFVGFRASVAFVPAGQRLKSDLLVPRLDLIGEAVSPDRHRGIQLDVDAVSDAKPGRRNDVALAPAQHAGSETMLSRPSSELMNRHCAPLSMTCQVQYCGRGFVTYRGRVGNSADSLNGVCQAFVVPDGRGVAQVGDPWRDVFRRADRLPATAPALERRRRGQSLEQILQDMLAEAELAPRIRFRPRGEEIDGSFFHRGRFLLLEAKWTQDPLPASSIYQFRGKIEGKLVGTIGIFISMSGFSADAIDAIVAGKVINTVLFDGDDIRAVADGQVDFVAALDRKLRAAAESGTPFLPLRDPVSKRTFDIGPEGGGPNPTKTAVVEGRFDAVLVHALADELGPSIYQIEVLLAGGTFNLAALANAARRVKNGESVLIIADGDEQPEAVRRRIESDLSSFNSEAERQVDVLVFEPTFGEALGVTEGFGAGQRRDPKIDRSLMRTKVRAANVRLLAENNSEVRKLLRDLGLDR